MKLNRTLLAAGYLLAALMVVLPLAETLLAIWPVQPGETRWRFGATGLFSRVLLSPATGLLIAAVLAASAGHRLTLRFVSVLAYAGAVVCLLSSGLFVLDFLEVRANLLPGAQTASVKAGLGALLRLWLTVGLAALIGRGSWIASRADDRHRRAGQERLIFASAPPVERSSSGEGG